MANITITDTTNTIKVLFNDLSGVVGLTKGIWRKEQINNIALTDNEDVVEIIIDHQEWLVRHTDGSSNALLVDTVNGVAPSSTPDLYDKLSALIE